MTTQETTTDANTAIPGFHNLSPESILTSLEAEGFPCSGHVNALNSYENRVYQIGIEDSANIVAKFYRPGRWTDQCIIEELDFTIELAELELPVIAPVANKKGGYLFRTDDFRFSIYPAVGGRAPELDNPDHLKILGRFLARIHNIGSVKAFAHRPGIEVTDYVDAPSSYLLDNKFIPADIESSYISVIEYLSRELKSIFAQTENINLVRLHGDCHLGNILWLNDAPFMVDFDDARTGPVIQDMWMFLSGDRDYMTARLHDILSGYTEFRDFSGSELLLIEPLRTMRQVHYAGWLARRWSDPAFPMAFPWFNTQRYWEEHVLALKEQMALIHETPLQWYP